MFSSNHTTLYEGIWKIKNVSVIGNDQILVNFTTAFFESEEEAISPRRETPYKFGPAGKSVQSIKIDKSELPDINEFNRGNRHKIHNVLTEELDLEVREE